MATAYGGNGGDVTANWWSSPKAGAGGDATATAYARSDHGSGDVTATAYATAGFGGANSLGSLTGSGDQGGVAKANAGGYSVGGGHVTVSATAISGSGTFCWNGSQLLGNGGDGQDASLTDAVYGGSDHHGWVTLSQSAQAGNGGGGTGHGGNGGKAISELTYPSYIGLTRARISSTRLPPQWGVPPA